MTNTSAINLFTVVRQCGFVSSLRYTLLAKCDTTLEFWKPTTVVGCSSQPTRKRLVEISSFCDGETDRSNSGNTEKLVKLSFLSMLSLICSLSSDCNKLLVFPCAADKNVNPVSLVLC